MAKSKLEPKTILYTGPFYDTDSDLKVEELLQKTHIPYEKRGGKMPKPGRNPFSQDSEYPILEVTPRTGWKFWDRKPTHRYEGCKAIGWFVKDYLENPSHYN